MSNCETHLLSPNEGQIGGTWEESIEKKGIYAHLQYQLPSGLEMPDFNFKPKTKHDFLNNASLAMNFAQRLSMDISGNLSKISYYLQFHQEGIPRLISRYPHIVPLFEEKIRNVLNEVDVPITEVFGEDVTLVEYIAEVYSYLKGKLEPDKFIAIERLHQLVFNMHLMTHFYGQNKAAAETCGNTESELQLLRD